MKSRIDQLLSLIANKEPSPGLIQNLSELCNLLWEERDLPGLRKYTDLLGKASLASRNQWGMAKTQSFQGLCYYFTGGYDKALESQFHALRAFRRLDDKLQTALCLKEIGNCYDRTEHFEKASQFTQQALEIVRELGDDKLYAYLTNNLANIYMSSGAYTKAEDCYTESIAISRKLGNTLGEAVATLNMGDLSQRQKKHERALELLEKSQALFMAINHRFGLSQNYYHIGRTYQSMKENERALEFMHKSMDIALEVEYAESIRDVSKAISDIYRDMGVWDKALSYYRDYNQHRNNMFNEQSGRKMAALETQYRLELHEKEAEVHRLKNEELEQAISALEKATRKLEETQRRMVLIEQQNVAMAMAVDASDAIRVPLEHLNNFVHALREELLIADQRTLHRVGRIEQSLKRIDDILERIKGIDVQVKMAYSDHTSMFDIHGAGSEPDE